ncbi:MAG: hypothetical protein NVS3B18_16580 [Candidatus Dormibacteria bacterium]
MRNRVKVSRLAQRVRSGVSDMSYAQRRVFENQTGIGTRGQDRRRRSAEDRGSAEHGHGPAIAAGTRELEALYAQDVKTNWR